MESNCLRSRAQNVQESDPRKWPETTVRLSDLRLNVAVQIVQTGLF